jgi:hypothetical protein
MSTRPDTLQRERPPWLMSAGILLALSVTVAFILRDVLAQRGPPGLESRIFYSSEVYTRSVLTTGQLPVGWLTASWRAHRSIDAGRV